MRKYMNFRLYDKKLILVMKSYIFIAESAQKLIRNRAILKDTVILNIAESISNIKNKSLDIV